MILRPVLLLMPLLLLAASLPALGHRLNAALTTVEINERRHRLEVVHRFYVHDAEQALPRLMAGSAAADAPADMLDDPATRLRFALYVHQRFRLVMDGEPLPLDLLGAETEGEYLWIYQIGALPAADARSLRIEQPALQELWADQVNQVNVRLGGPVRTLELRAGDGFGTLTLP